MPEIQAEPFDERLGRIQKRHRKMADGYVTRLGKDGLITARPTRRIRFPWKFMLLIAVLFILFKGATLAALGPGSYAERVARLAQGNGSERIGAFLMQPEVATIWAARLMQPLFLGAAEDTDIQSASASDS